jgi:hypothetical protein
VFEVFDLLGCCVNWLGVFYRHCLKTYRYHPQGSSSPMAEFFLDCLTL